ncbi:MAG: type II toxin-antitoxin system RelE/ParE family toxin [Methylococcales bacterium]
MKWSIEIKKKALNELSKISKNDRVKIGIFLNETLENLDNPRQYGKALEGKFKGLWRYRVGNYRIICDIRDNELVIIAVEIGHRSRVYKN